MTILSMHLPSSTVFLLKDLDFDLPPGDARPSVHNSEFGGPNHASPRRTPIDATQHVTWSLRKPDKPLVKPPLNSPWILTLRPPTTAAPLQQYVTDPSELVWHPFGHDP